MSSLQLYVDIIMFLKQFLEFFYQLRNIKIIHYFKDSLSRNQYSLFGYLNYLSRCLENLSDYHSGLLGIWKVYLIVQTIISFSAVQKICLSLWFAQNKDSLPGCADCLPHFLGIKKVCQVGHTFYWLVEQSPLISGQSVWMFIQSVCLLTKIVRYFSFQIILDELSVWLPKTPLRLSKKSF